MAYMQPWRKFEDTPYLFNEIMAAKAEFLRACGGSASRSLLTLQRKCQFAVNGPRLSDQIASFSNRWFTDTHLQPPFPEIPDSQLSIIRDDNYSSAVQASTSAASDVRSDSATSGNLGSDVSRGMIPVSGKLTDNVKTGRTPAVSDAMLSPSHQSGSGDGVHKDDKPVSRNIAKKVKTGRTSAVSDPTPSLSRQPGSGDVVNKDVNPGKQISKNLTTQNTAGVSERSPKQTTPVATKRKLNQTEPVTKTAKEKPTDAFIDLIADSDVIPDTLEPPAKKPCSNSSAEKVSDNLYWKCDLCDNMAMKMEEMNKHLESKGHYSASLVKCEWIEGRLTPLVVMAPAGMQHLPSLGNINLPTCPDGKCWTAFPDIYSCSQHYSDHHSGRPRKEYALRNVLLQLKVPLHSGRTCYCGHLFKNPQEFGQHVKHCKKWPIREQYLKKTLLFFMCCQCNSFCCREFVVRQHVEECPASGKGNSNAAVRIFFTRTIRQRLRHLPVFGDPEEVDDVQYQPVASGKSKPMEDQSVASGKSKPMEDQSVANAKSKPRKKGKKLKPWQIKMHQRRRNQAKANK